MEFNHTEERQMLIDTLARYLQNEYPLKDRNDAAISEHGFNPGQWDTLAELGILGAFFPEDQGGFGGSAFDITAVFEELGRKLVVEPLLDCALRPGQLLAGMGDPDRLTDIISGAHRYVAALGDSHGDLMPVTATRAGTQWVLNGVSPLVKFGSGADAILVEAQSGMDALHTSLFVLKPATKGLTMTHHATFDGGSVSDIHFDNVVLSAEALLGSEHGAKDVIRTAEAWSCLAICAEALGIMETIKADTLDYLRTRSQFGTVIGRFQALQHRMAQVLLEIEQARSAVINAAAAMTKDAAERDRAISAAKYTIGRIGALVAEEAIQLHGGIGMTWEYDMGHFAKRLVMIDHEMGDADHHLARYVQAELL
ncbi:acyl-CoA dehydrogenase family protein [Celeribacter marinus]|uniref:acyl-CoA dehydrogenase family protein n=1 Tax=Celeribacter marinus TaxID=1397108 RepID=UPI003F6AE285